MKYQYLMADQKLFRDRDVFEIDHIPDQYEYREAPLRELAFSLSPGLQGSRPLNTVLRGLPGTGKTTSVQGAAIYCALQLCTSVPDDINLAVPSAIHFSQTSLAIGSGRWSRTSWVISFICFSCAEHHQENPGCPACPRIARRGR